MAHWLPARQMVDSGRWVCLDLETTDLTAGARIIEVAVVDQAARILVDSLVCQPACPSIVSSRVHGITAETLRGAPSWQEIAPAISAHLAQKTVVSYNASFDEYHLRMALADDRNAPQIGSWWCLLDNYEAFRGFRPPLATACEIEGIPLRPTHRALADALAARALLLSIAGRPAQLL